MVTRSVSFEVALFERRSVIVIANCGTNASQTTSFSLRESRALRPGEGPPRPLPRPTLPLRGRVT